MAKKIIVNELISKLGFSYSDADKMNLKQFQKGMTDITKTAGLIVGALNAAGIAAFAYVNNLSRSVDENSKFAESVDMSYESLQRMEHAVEVAGGSADGLKSSLSTLSRVQNEYRLGNEKSIETLARLGVQVLDSQGKARKLEDVYLDLAETGKRMSAQGNKGLFNTLVSQLGISDSAQLLALQQGKTALADLMNEASVMSDKSKKNAADFRDTMTRLGNTFNDIRNIIMEDLAPIIEGLINNIREYIKENKEIIKVNLVKFIKSLAEVLKNTWDIIRDITPTLIEIIVLISDLVGWLMKCKPVLYTIFGMLGIFAGTKVVTFIVGIITTLKALSGILLTVTMGAKAFFAALVANPLMWIPLAIAGLIWLANNIEKVTEWFTKMYQESSLFKGIADFILDYIYAPIQKVGEVIGWLYDIIAGLPQMFEKACTTIKDMFVESFKFLSGFIPRITGKIIDAAFAPFKWLGTKIMDIFGSIGKNLAGLFLNFTPVGLFAKFIINNFDSIKKAASVVIKAVAGQFLSLWEGIKSGVSSVVNAFKWLWGQCKTLGKYIADLFLNFTPLGNIIKLIINNFDTLKAAVLNIADSILSVFNNIGTSFKSFFSSIINSILSAFNKFGTTLKSIWNNIGKIITNAFMNYTPVGRFIGYVIQNMDKIKAAFGMVVKGILKGWNMIKSGFSTVINSILGFFSPIKTAVQFVIKNFDKIKTAAFTALKFIAGQFVLLWNGIKSGIAPILNVFGYLWERIKAGISAIISWLPGIWENIKSQASNAIEFIVSIIPKVWNRIKSGASLIIDYIKPVIDWIQKIIDKVKWAVGAAKSIASAPVKAAKEAVAGAVSKVGNMFSSGWNYMKSGFSSMSKNIAPMGAYAIPPQNFATANNAPVNNTNNNKLNLTINTKTNATAQEIAEEVNKTYRQIIQTNTPIERG